MTFDPPPLQTSFVCLWTKGVLMVSAFILTVFLALRSLNVSGLLLLSEETSHRHLYLPILYHFNTFAVAVSLSGNMC